MEKFTTLTGVAAPLPIDNIDTDMIIPKQYLKTIKRTGLGAGLFAECAIARTGAEQPDFVLNKPAYRKARSCGGRQFRLRFVARACALGAARFRRPLRNRDRLRRYLLQQLLQERHSAGQVSPEDHAKLMDDAERGANATLTIDLAKQEIRGPDGGMVKFSSTPSASNASSRAWTTSASRWSKRRGSQPTSKRRAPLDRGSEAGPALGGERRRLIPRDAVML